MGLRGDIDQLSETVKNLSPTETDPLSLHLDQTTPQTITNGIPLLTGLTPTTDYQIATKKYVDDSVATENLWDRTGTTITPHTAGDSLSGFTSISAKSFTAELNYGYYWTNADDRITVDGSHNMTLHNNGADAITILANGNVGIGVTNPVSPLVVKDVNATGLAQAWQKSTGAVFAYADATNSALSSIYFHLGNGGKGQWYPTKLSGISTFQLQWVATANASNPPDVGIKRHGVNVLEVNNGTAGQLATLVAGNVGIGVTDPDAMLEVSGNIHLTTDNDKLLFGTASDASIYYDATNLVINPKEVGSGVVSVLGNINITSSDNYRSMLITQGSAGNNAAITFYEGAFGMNRYATIGTNGAGKFVITSGQFTNSDPYLYFHTSGYGSSIHTSDSSNLYGQANINSEVAIGATYPAIQSLMRGISGSTEIAYSVVSGATYTESQISLYFNGAAVFNEQGNDADFRVEGNTVTHLLFVDASADAVKIQADNSKLFLGAGDDASFYYDASNLIVNPREAGSGFMRYSSAINRRYYHLPLGSANPGASGATWVEAGANTTGGWRLTNATWLLRGQADVHADWDGASDMKIGVNFMVNVDNTGGAAGDTVDLKATVYYKGVGDTATKSQIVEVATTVGQSAQYKQFRAEFTINWDETSNVVEVGDIIAILLNLETDTSEVDDIVVTSMEFSYNTAHIGIESGDI